MGINGTVNNENYIKVVRILGIDVVIYQNIEKEIFKLFQVV